MNTDPARFDRVTEHPDYAATADRQIRYSSVAAIAMPSGMTLFGVLFLVIAIGLFISIKPPLWFAILFLLGALLFISTGAGMAVRGVRFHNAPIVRLVAVILKERHEVSGGGQNGMSASTTYYTTLQTRDGTRAEYVTPNRLVGKLAVDDIGVAYVKGHMLVEFTRFDV